MFYLVCDTDKVSSHYIANYDLADANPGLSLRYWQPTNSWFAYCDSTSSVANVSASAAGTAANAKVLLGVRVNGTSLSISVNGAVTTGGVAAAPFTATRLILNKNGTSLGRVYDIESFTTYDVGTAQRVEGELAAKHGITLPAGHPYRLGAPTTAWNHSDDTGLQAWYDFADSSTVTITGAGISSLLNKAVSGGYTLTQGTDAYRPTWDGSTATGRDDSASDGLAITTTVSFTAADHMLLSVCGFSAFAGGYQKRAWNIYAAGALTAGAAFVLGSPNQVRVRSSYNVPVSTADITLFSGYTPPQNTLLGLTHVGTTKTIYNYGTQLSTESNAVNTLLAAVQLKLMVSGDTTMKSFIATSSTSTAIRQKHEGKAAWDKGVQASLDAGHPYKTRPPLITD
jgi:hypothetical protein